MPKYRVTTIVNARNASEARAQFKRINPYPDWSQRNEPVVLSRDAVYKLRNAGLIKDDASIRVVELIVRRESLSENEIFYIVSEAARQSGGVATSQSIADVFKELREGPNEEVAHQLSQYRIEHIADDFVPGGKYSKNPYYDGIDVKKLADTRVREVARSAGTDINTIRNIAEKDVKNQFQVAVKYMGVPKDLYKYWKDGWRKGFGVR